MLKLIRRFSRKAGLPPGSLVYVGEERKEAPRVTILEYDAEHFEERDIARPEECVPVREAPGVTWISVTGVHDPEVVRHLGVS